MIIVAQDGSGAFDSIQEAINSIQVLPETIYVKKGTYHERVEIKCPFLTIEGEDEKETVLEYDLYANEMLTPDEKRGTFRSYTMLIHTDHFTCRNMTIANTAGFGTEVGQALAVYAEGDRIIFENCTLLGHQDTLFTGPLPKEEAKCGGFRGPTEHSPRVVGHQLYKECYIEGEVDFIFGSAIAYFDRCRIHSLNRDMDVNGYVTAASTYEGIPYGYVFNQCHFTSNCPEGTVYLGRPWRIYAKTVLLNCELDAHIKPEGFFDWNKPESHDTVVYAEYKNYGPGYQPQNRNPYVRQLTDEEALNYNFEKVWNYKVQ
ncbi:MAG: pectinesterase family protein [Lachnospiraceae bacterium]